ncbi:DarT ssDNA thymidine ADP-ribosyltransferase family protein [Agromyces humatus]|uniref:DarT domain-containing protein n=1 Tax=Agromyces humatus TaxID=279573 RepID=A0ABN2K7C6_9MICO|nr:DarT ssDNA thymidine ADP-ribosyltransferase family protein [Agromyces humatus]
MADECIHGFEDGMCAICFPPKEPAPKPVAAPKPRGSRAGVRAARPAARVPGAPHPSADAAIDAKAMRIYHVTHLDNLGRILGSGALLADAADPGARPEVDIAAPAAREFRRAAEVSGTDAVVADYVPFLLTPDAHVWDAVRTTTPDPRLDAAAVERPAADYVIFVSSVGVALGARTEVLGEVVLSDADAAVAGARTAAEWPEIERMLRRLARDDDGSAIASAELLVREALPIERVSLIAVSNEKVRDRVRDALRAVGLRTRVAVYPPWFLPGTDAAE